MYRLLYVASLLAVANSASISIGEPHIVGGVPATIEQYPFQVSLICYNRHICGGSILGPKYIVTAAHCFDTLESPWDYQVRVGSTDKTGGGTVIKLSKYFSHPSYEYGKLDFDVGVGYLSQNLNFGTKVQPITLVPMNKEPQPGEMVTVSGWGYITASMKETTNLRAVTVPIVSRANCRERNSTVLTSNMICAGSYGKSTFRGDSGGPLVNAKKELVGIVSFSDVERLLEVPGVFTNIASATIHQFITKYSP